MRDRLEKWEARYAAGEGTLDFAPSAPLPYAASLVEPGRALDVAAGAGRHALYLAELGWRVVALEGARAGLDRLVREAERRGVADRIEARQCDLEGRPLAVEIEENGYDLVCDFFFLHRPLFDDLRRAVRPGGLFVAAIHVEDPADQATHGYLLRAGELRALVDGWGWEVLSAREGLPVEGGHARAAAEIVARRPLSAPSRS